MEKLSRRFGIAVTLVFAAMLIAWAISAAKQFSLITVAIALGLTLTCIYSISMMRQSKAVSFQSSFDTAGTRIRPDSRIEKNLRRVIVAGTISTWLMFIAWIIGVLYLPFDEFQYAFPFCAVAAGAVLAWCWIRLSSQGSLSYLFLTPEGFEFATLTAPKSGKWEDVEEIAGKLPNEERFWNPMVVTMNGGATLLMEAPGTYTPKGTALVELVRLYWQHPELRDELTDGRAVERLRAQLGNRPNL